jgi:hypothetical protein
MRDLQFRVIFHAEWGLIEPSYEAFELSAVWTCGRAVTKTIAG